MCEIAVVDPEQFNLEMAQQIAGTFYQEQGDGLGILCVIPDNGSFTYETYKSVDPHWGTVYAFMRRHWADSWRMVIHGRAGTSGGRNRQSAHPIHVDCDLCDFEWVVHNGSVRNHSRHKSRLDEDGHQRTTDVDTEVIPHKVSELPDDISDHKLSTYRFYGNLNYLLFAEGGILIHVESKYHLSDDVTMTCRLNDFEDHAGLGFSRGTDTEWMLVEPKAADEDGIASVQTKERAYTNSTTSHSKYRSGGTSRSGTSGHHSNRQTGQRSTTQANGANTHIEEYEDHAKDIDGITAVKVAPGVMKVIDAETGDEDYVFRRDDPRSYFWYAPESAPVGREELAAAESGDEKGTQASLEEYEQTAGVLPEGATEREKIDAYARRIAKEEDIPLDEAKWMAERVHDTLEGGVEAAIASIE